MWLPDVANKNIGHPIKFEFQINCKNSLEVCSMKYLDILTLKKVFSVYLNSYFADCVAFSDSPEQGGPEAAGSLSRIAWRSLWKRQNF